MAIVQISKIQHRFGNIVDLPQLDEAELGFATDAKKLYIGKVSPNENIEVLTSYSNIALDQIEGAVGNLDISAVSVADGQVLTYDGSNWVNRGGAAGGLIDLGEVANVRITGGAIGYVLETDGTGNLAWTPKTTVLAGIQNATQANPCVITTEEDNFFTEGSRITITNVPGMTQLNGNSYYANIISSNSFALYSDAGLTTTVNATGYSAFSITTVTQTFASSNKIAVGNTALVTLNAPVRFIGTLFGGLSTDVTYYVKTIPDAGAPGNITVSLTEGGSNLTLTSASGTANVYVTGGRIISDISGAGSATAGGSNTAVQFNNNNILDGDADFTWNYLTNLLTVNGNANVGNLNATTVVTASRFTSNIATGTAPLTVTSTTRVANLNVAYANVADHINTAVVSTGTYYPLLANATSGNVADGANANLTFNAATGNLKSTLFYASSTITAVGNITGGNVNTAGKVVASTLESNVATGTAPLTVTSTTRVSNLNVDYANVADFINVADVSSGTYYPVLANAATGNVAEGSNAALTFNAATGALNATLLGGALTTAAQPNVTSLGTLTSLTVSGTISGNDIATFGTTGDTMNITGAGNTNVNGAGGAINITAAQGNGTGQGGNLVFTAGTANASGNADGGTVTLTSGNGYGQGQGGTIGIYSGSSANTYGALGGNLVITGGAFDGAGGDVALSAGQAVGLNKIGGDVVINTGSSTGSAIAGKIILRTSTPGSSGNTVQVLNDRVIIDENDVNVIFTTAATSTTSGALIVAGGVGVAGNVYANMFYGNGYGLTYIAGGNVVGAVSSATSATSATTAGTVTTAAQPNITSTGTLTTLSVSYGAITSTTPILLQQTWNNSSVSFTGIRENITDTASDASSLLLDLQVGGTSKFSVKKDGTASGYVFVSSATTGTAPLTVNSTTKVANLNADLLDGLNTSSSDTTGSSVVIRSGGSFSANVVTATLLAGTLSTAAQPNITSVSSSFTDLTFANAQTLSGNNLSFTTGANTNPGTITGNWSLTAGSRLNATYADLAEYYESDQNYEPGTVLEFGGEKEVTLAEDATTRVAGVVSTNPAYAMNAKCPGVAVPIALQGRVPVKVRGSIKKGDLMVSGGNGYARPATSPTMGSVIGKALENFNGTDGIIEIAVGRL